MFSDDDVAQAVAAAVGAGLRDVDLGVIEAVMRATADVWRKRVEGAADALADVLPGEVGRLDLLARIAELKREMEEAQSSLRRLEGSLLRIGERLGLNMVSEPDIIDAIAHLKPSGQVAEDVALIRQHMDPAHDSEDLCAACSAHRALEHLAAKAQGYEAAVADNAALVEFCRTERQMLALLYHRIKALGVHDATDATDAMTDAMTTVERWMDAVLDTYEQSRPGAALLEQHRKEVAGVRALGRLLGHGEALEWLRDHHGGALRPTAADLSAHLDGLRSRPMKEPEPSAESPSR